MNIKEEQAARWNGPAGHAWVELQDVLDRLFQPIETLLAEAAARTDQVLDVGCGTGSTTRALAAKARQVTGIDLSAPMIERARALGGDYLCGDAATYPYPEQAYDLLVSRFGVMFFDDPVAAFAHLRRAMQPGGRMDCITWRSAEQNPFMTAAEQAAAPLLPGLPPRQPGPGQFGLSDRGEVMTMLYDAGWRDIKVTAVDLDCSMREADLQRYIGLLGPVGQALQQADEATRARVLEAVSAAFDPWRHDGWVTFKAACWRLRAVAR